MRRPKPTFGSIYTDVEERLLGPWQRVRQRLLTPVVVVLVSLGMGADFLSFSSVALGIGFCLAAPVSFDLAFWLLVGAVVCDGLDGVAARLKGVNTPRGAFTDMFCDLAVVAFCVAGLAWRGTVYPVLAILFVYIYTTMVIFMMLHRLLNVSLRWILRPSRMLLFVAIGIEYAFHFNILNYLLGFYLLTLPLMGLSFWRLRNAL